MLTEKENLYKKRATFRGVPFFIENETRTFGRRTQVHEYPGRDLPLLEDLGRATRRIHIRGYLAGEDVPAQRDALINAIEKPEPAILVHPFYGELRVNIDGAGDFSYQRQAGGICSIQFQVVECGEKPLVKQPPSARHLLSNQLNTLDSLLNKAAAEINHFSAPVLHQVTAAINSVNKTLQPVDSGLNNLFHLFKGDWSLLLPHGSAGSDLILALQQMWRTGRRLSNSNELLQRATTYSSLSLANFISPRTVSRTAPISVQRRHQQQNAALTLVRLTLLQEAMHSVQQLLMLNEQSPSFSIDAGFALKQQLMAAIESEAQRTGDHPRFALLMELKATCAAGLPVASEQQQRLQQQTPEQSLPAIVLAYQLMGDESDLDTFIPLNAVTHPGFVPQKPLYYFAGSS